MGTKTRGDDDIEKNRQKMIPDGWIGRFFLDAPFNSPPNRLDDRETFVEFKTLAPLAMAAEKIGGIEFEAQRASEVKSWHKCFCYLLG